MRVSYAIKGDPAQVRKRLKATPQSLVALSAFTQAELLYGLARRPEAIRLRAQVEEFLLGFPVLSWDSAAASSYGDLRAAQERKGRPLSHEDLMISAHALSMGLTLITSDRAFSFVDGLKTEDWTAG
ncbi:MAG: type II toxin-antitoxin system VapC family toxin [Terracidiphilus sp.]